MRQLPSCNYSLTVCDLFRFFLPVILLVPYVASVVVKRLRRAPRPKAVPATTESSLRRALSDVSSIHHLLPHFPSAKNIDPPPFALLRLLVVLYCGYALVVYLVPANFIIGIGGTILLTWRAPWARTTRNIVTSNGWAKYVSRRSWQITTGTTPVYPSSANTLSVDTSGFTSPKIKGVTALSIPANIDVPPSVPASSLPIYRSRKPAMVDGIGLDCSPPAARTSLLDVFSPCLESRSTPNGNVFASNQEYMATSDWGWLSKCVP